MAKKDVTPSDTAYLKTVSSHKSLSSWESGILTYVTSGTVDPKHLRIDPMFSK